jgi:hypothetical protein
MNVEPTLEDRKAEEAAAARADFLKRVNTTMSNSELVWWLNDRGVDASPVQPRKRGVSRRQELVQLVMATYDLKQEGHLR